MIQLHRHSCLCGFCDCRQIGSLPVRLTKPHSQEWLCYSNSRKLLNHRHAGGLSLKFLKGRVCARTDGGTMRIVLNIVGVLLVLLGSIWVLQGINVLPGSFMSGQMRWAVRGGILVVAGIVGLLYANRKRKSAA
jgi:hypothetical protein